MAIILFPSVARCKLTPASSAVQVEFVQIPDHLQQIRLLEKRLFGKSDGWRGEHFNEQLLKRNVYLLYAVTVQDEVAHNRCDNQADVALHQPQHSGQQQQQDLQRYQQHCGAGVVLGYIIIQVNSIAAHVNKLAVAPEARRSGLGTRLLLAALQVAVSERRAQCATLHVAVSNTAALGLYSKAGFVKDGTIHDYYGQGRHAYKLIAPSLQSLEDMAACRAGG